MLALAIAGVVPIAAQTTNKTVKIDSGVEGAVSSNVLSFKGIPEAAPPVGNLRCSSYFANFAKSGNPNGQPLSTWSKYDPAKPDLMMFTLNNGSVMEADAWKKRLDNQTWAARDLGGTSWQLVKFQGGDEKTLIPDDKAKYTIAFNAQGQVSVRIDCNRGRSTWKSIEPNQLQFGSLALTRAKCPPGSLYDRIVKDWSFVRSYTLKNDRLFLSLMADGGVYEFEPIRRSQPVAPQRVLTTPVYDLI